MPVDKINFTSRPINKNELKMLKSAIKEGKAFLYDVDTSNGYMHPEIIRPDGIRDGLHLPDAESIIPKLSEITSKLKGKMLKLETIDAHKFGDPVMDQFKKETDIYCEKGTWGSAKIPETIFGEPDVLIDVEPAIKDVPSVNKIKELFAKNGIIRLEKNELCPLNWGNRFTHLVERNEKGFEFFNNLKQSGAKIAVVYGVATDYCVKEAVRVLKAFGIKPIIISDAIKELAEKSTEIPNHEVFGDVLTITTKQLNKVVNSKDI